MQRTLSLRLPVPKAKSQQSDASGCHIFGERTPRISAAHSKDKVPTAIGTRAFTGLAGVGLRAYKESIHPEKIPGGQAS